MNDKKQYCITVKMYAWAETPDEALVGLIGDLDYLIKDCDTSLNGYEHPGLEDIIEDTEI